MELIHKTISNSSMYTNNYFSKDTRITTPNIFNVKYLVLNVENNIQISN